jgi:uncharacterized membrane protein
MMTNEFEAFARLERYLGRLLLVGLATASALLTLGLVMQIAVPAGNGSGTLLTMGLVTLMATPMLRVIASVVEYARMREWFFVLTTLVVLAELTVSVVVALRR